jgi:hypothetical protein
MRAWGAGIATGHLCLGLAAWLLIGVPPWFFGGCALVTMGVALIAAPLLRRRGDDGDDDLGGGGPEDPEPPWWPEFEREFRAYADARERTPA